MTLAKKDIVRKIFPLQEELAEANEEIQARRGMFLAFPSGSKGKLLLQQLNFAKKVKEYIKSEINLIALDAGNLIKTPRQIKQVKAKVTAMDNALIDWLKG